MTFSFPKKRTQKKQGVGRAFSGHYFRRQPYCSYRAGSSSSRFFFHIRESLARAGLFFCLCVPSPSFFAGEKNNGGDKSSPTHLLPFPTLCPVAAAVLSAANCRSSESEVEGDSTKLAKKRKTNSLRETIGEFNPSKKKLEQTAVFPFIPFFSLRRHSMSGEQINQARRKRTPL